MDMNNVYCFSFFVFMMFVVNMEVYANSSWHWFTDEPYTALFPVIILTLIFEIGFILYFNLIKKLTGIIIGSISIIIANLLSFLCPYIFLGFSDEPVPEGIENNFFEKISYFIYKWPQYTVGFGFILITILVELPIVYYLLTNYVKNNKKLFKTIIIANIISTLVIAVFERLKFRGSW